MKKKLLAATLASLLGASAQAQTTFVCDGVPCSFFGGFNGPGPGGGQVPTGINNLVVNGEVYNVTFSNTMSSPFTTIAEGMAAADAIGNFVASFLINPALVGGGLISSPYGAYVETEFGTPNSVLIQTAWSGSGPYNGAFLSGEIGNACGTGVNIGVGFNPPASVCTTWTKVSTSNKLLNGTFVPATPGCQLGATSIPNWNVANNVKNCNAGAIAAPNGTTYYVDLTGTEVESGNNDIGAISQTVNTVVGKKYTLSFYFGGNPLWKVMNPKTSTNDGEYKAMQVLINNSVQGVYGAHTANAAYNNAQWQKETMSFTATTPFTSVAFQSLNGLVTPSEYGPLIGDVVLVED